MRILALVFLATGLIACGPETDQNNGDPVSEMPGNNVTASPTVGPAEPPPQATAGTARVSLTGDGVSVAGEYPATLCGGPYIMGEGVSFQTLADGWQITLASESRRSGTFALQGEDPQYVLNVNGPGIQLVARPGGPTVLTVADDFRRAEVTDAELRQIVGASSAQLSVTFDCE